MQMRRLAIMLFCMLPLAALMYGCGSSNKEGTGTLASTATVDEATCRICHATTIEPVTSSNIVTDYLASAHNLTPDVRAAYPNGIGCQGCHGGGAQHNGVGPIPYPNPDSAGQCFTCHQSHLSAAHYYTMSSTQDPNAQTNAEFVSKNYQNSCTSCHDPHKADKADAQERSDWAGSGHGDVTSPAWSTEDFKQSTSCIRCHTATGFKNFVTSNWTLPTTTWATAGDPTRQVLACDACHSNYNFKNSVRSAGQFTAPYKVAWKLPDASTSNICVACHTGRVNQSDINAVADFSNASFQNSHYMAAAGLMYMSVGYTGFVPGSTVIGASTYAKSLTIDNVSDTVNGIAGGVTSTHRKFGTSLMATDSHAAGQFMVEGGPCVTCHMNANWVDNAGTAKRTTSHDIGFANNIGDVFTQVCSKCHTSEGGVALTTANFQTVFLTPNKEAFQDALQLAIAQLAQYNISYNPNAYPYFYDLAKDPTGATAVKDWTRSGKLTQANAKNLMGACYNINLLTKEPGAYVHARTYTRRLIYDTIDFLDDGVINLSVGTTAVNSGLKDSAGNLLFTKAATAYTGGAPYLGGTLTPGTSEAMAYILGWTSSGAWSSPERP